MDTMTIYYTTKFDCFMAMKKDFESEETRKDLGVVLNYYGYTIEIDELKGVLLSLIDQLSDEELFNVMYDLSIDFEWYDDLFKLFKEVSSCLTK